MCFHFDELGVFRCVILPPLACEEWTLESVEPCEVAVIMVGVDLDAADFLSASWGGNLEVKVFDADVTVIDVFVN